MTSITTNVKGERDPIRFSLGQKIDLIQAKKISFVETGKNAEYSI